VACTGRHAPAWWLALPTITLPAVAFVRDDQNPASPVFLLTVVLVAWAAGRLVRRRAESATAARAEAAELASADPAARTARLVADERARLAGEALGVVRAAVDRMLCDADDAARDLDPRACAAVQASGRRAVAELRRLLGLLRSEEDPPTGRPSDDAPERGGHSGSAPQPRDVLVALAAMGVVLLDLAVIGAAWPSVALMLAACGGLALVRTEPAGACAVAAAASGGALVVDRPLAHGFTSVVLAVLLAWGTAASGRRGALAALGVWTLLTLVEIRVHEPGSEALLLALVLVGAVSGCVWSARRSDESASRATAGRLRAAQAVAADRAVRAERLRVARDLHDVASSGIGVMVLQAAAAEVQAEREPAAARRALDAVRTAGLQARTELSLLFGLLDAGAIGAAGLAGAAAVDDLPAALTTLATRMRSGGMDVTLEIGTVPIPHAGRAATVYRVVQESLTNAARHAPGSRVHVRLVSDGDTLTISVEDDGPGAPADTPGAGFGLVGLAERVRGDGGRVEVGTRPGGGFGVAARLPVRTAELPSGTPT
jgi:signal transduction histidine kinase